MGYRKKIVAVLMGFILHLFFSFVTMPVYAMDSQNEQLEQIDEALNISVFYQYKAEHLIKCFDVNESGNYAIGCENNTILIFDAHDVFQYGVRFEPTGTYGIAELKDNSIVIYLARGDTLFEVDSTGKCISLEKIPFSNNFSDDALYRAFKQIGNTEYYLERDIGITHGNYSRLVRTEATGTKTILYDVTVRGYIVGVLYCILFSLVPIGIIAIVVSKVRKESKQVKEIGTGDGSASSGQNS